MKENTKTFLIGAISGIVLATVANTAAVLIHARKRHNRNQISLAVEDYERALNKIK